MIAFPALVIAEHGDVAREAPILHDLLGLRFMIRRVEGRRPRQQAEQQQ